MLDLGMLTLNQAFPNADIKTFIAPYDRISPVAIKEVLQERMMNLSTMSTNLVSMPEFQQIKGHGYTKLGESQWLYICDEYFYSHRDDPQESLQQIRASLAEHELTTIVNHYWMFYYDWKDNPNEDIMTSWNQLLDEVLYDDSIQIIPFSQNDSINKI